MAERAKGTSAASAAGRTGSEAASRTGRTAPAKKAPAKKAAARKSPAGKSAAESSGSTAETGGEGQSMAEATNTRTSARGGAKTGAKSGTKSAAKSATKSAAKAAGKKDGQKKSGATSAGGSSTAKSATKATTAGQPKKGRTAAETERIRAALQERRDELREEYDLHLAEIAELQRDRLTDSAGDDQADTGSKTFEREQEISLANSILERIKQVERALERLDEGSYGWCERCGDAIPVERLAAFPSATLCVRCKQLEERR
jgi:RNA polymerase-binding protein DksA